MAGHEPAKSEIQKQFRLKALVFCSEMVSDQAGLANGRVAMGKASADRQPPSDCRPTAGRRVLYRRCPLRGPKNKNGQKVVREWFWAFPNDMPKKLSKSVQKVVKKGSPQNLGP